MVKTSEIDLTILLPSVLFVLYLKNLILYKTQNLIDFFLTSQIERHRRTENGNECSNYHWSVGWLLPLYDLPIDVHGGNWWNGVEWSMDGKSVKPVNLSKPEMITESCLNRNRPFVCLPFWRPMPESWWCIYLRKYKNYSGERWPVGGSLVGSEIRTTDKRRSFLLLVYWALTDEWRREGTSYDDSRKWISWFVSIIIPDSVDRSHRLTDRVPTFARFFGPALSV